MDIAPPATSTPRFFDYRFRSLRTVLATTGHSYQDDLVTISKVGLPGSKASKDLVESYWLQNVFGGGTYG